MKKIKTYNHIPRHLRPPKIPKLKIDKSVNFGFFRRYIFLIVGALVVPWFASEDDDQGIDDDF